MIRTKSLAPVVLAWLPRSESFEVDIAPGNRFGMFGLIKMCVENEVRVMTFQMNEQ
jgi:hypothetical protein